MPLTLTPSDVDALTGEIVTELDITLASEVIDAQTDRVPDDFVVAGLTESAVAAAWAIVAVRVHASMREGDESGVTSESQGDYSYSLDAARVKAHAADLLHGMPRTLLRIGVGRWTRHDTYRPDVLSDWWADPRGFVQTRTMVYPF